MNRAITTDQKQNAAKTSSAIDDHWLALPLKNLLY
jgi:hypothetical protein